MIDECFITLSTLLIELFEHHSNIINLVSHLISWENSQNFVFRVQNKEGKVHGQMTRFFDHLISFYGCKCSQKGQILLHWFSQKMDDG